MTIYQFLLLRRSGELLSSLNFSSSRVNPTLIADFISAVCTFSEELVGHKLSVVKAGRYKFIIDEINKKMLLAVLVDEQESILDIKLKIKKIKNLLLKKFKDELKVILEGAISNQFKIIEEEIKREIKEILEEQPQRSLKNTTYMLDRIISKIMQYSEINGVIILDKNCKELISRNISKSKRFVISKQLENLLSHPSIYPLEKLIFFMHSALIAVVIEEKLILVAVTTKNAYPDLVLSALENCIRKATKIVTSNKT